MRGVSTMWFEDTILNRRMFMKKMFVIFVLLIAFLTGCGEMPSASIQRKMTQIVRRSAKSVGYVEKIKIGRVSSPKPYRSVSISKFCDVEVKLQVAGKIETIVYRFTWCRKDASDLRVCSLDDVMIPFWGQ